MAKSFLTDLNLNNNVLLNAKIQAWGSAPTGTTNPSGSGTAVAGQISSYLGALYVFNGTAWVIVGNPLSDSTSTTSSTTGASSTAVKAAYDLANAALPKSGGTMTGTLAMGSNNITGTGSISATTFTGALTGNATTATTASATTGTLTFGTGLTAGGSSFNGSGNITITPVSATTSVAGIVQLSDSTSTTSSTLAATATAVKAAYDRGSTGVSDAATAQTTANAALPKAGGTMSGAIAMGTSKITGLGNPTDNQDAATKYYVDNSIANSQAGFNVHTAVRVASTAAITGTYTNGSADLSQGTGIGATFVGTAANLGVIDGVTLVANDRVLLKNQATATQNGVYTVTTVSTNITLTRASDFDNSVAGEVFPGDLVYVTAGTTNGGSTWAMTTVGTSTTPVNTVKIGTDNIVWAQFAGTTGGVLPGSQGGTGVANTGKTITLGGNLTTTVANISFAANASGSTVTLPATGTLATLAGSEALTSKTYNGLTISGSAGTLTIPTGATFITAGAFSITLTSTATTALTLPTNGTVLANPVTASTGTALAVTAGASNGTGNTGGALTLSGGQGITSAAGGSVTIAGGSGIAGGAVAVNGGSGATPGAVTIGGTNTASVGIGTSTITTTINGTVKLPEVAGGTAGFVKTATDGTLSRVATVANSEMATSTSTATATAAAATGNVTNARKAIGVGIGTGTAMVVNHGLGQWVTAQLYDTSGNLVEVDVLNASTSGGTTTFTFASSQTLTGFQYVIVG